ncbi:hypothetical protein PIB30_097596 [Stylosanthes scabra]|uniref:Uncharacterized protein n=1 Tax=Stylosanthes scabra TaxID=79078 RepID=A0ABU6VX77_9FABA|nr:hypothetical protein [Stylosanthes scabra]
MHPLVEDELGCSALMSGGRVRGWPQADDRVISRVERMSTRRLSSVDRRTYPMGLMCMIRAGLTPGHRKRILISFRVQISSWPGLSFRVRVLDQDLPHMHPQIDYQAIRFTDPRHKCMRCSCAVIR